MNNKAFTLIKLIAVIAIFGVLVLLAAPKFLGYTNDAKLAQIKNDVGGSDKEENIYVANDDDFEWVDSTDTGAYKNKAGEQGYFKYVGTGKETVEIPHVIDEVPMTSYYLMFLETGEDVKKVISTNKNITDMSMMFAVSQAITLDLSEFDTSKITDMSMMFFGSPATSIDLSNWDTSNVTRMGQMFYISRANIGYARSQADANKFNASSTDKPSGLNFIVK